MSDQPITERSLSTLSEPGAERREVPITFNEWMVVQHIRWTDQHNDSLCFMCEVVERVVQYGYRIGHHHAITEVAEGRPA